MLSRAPLAELSPLSLSQRQISLSSLANLDFDDDTGDLFNLLCATAEDFATTPALYDWSKASNEMMGAGLLAPSSSATETQPRSTVVAPARSSKPIATRSTHKPTRHKKKMKKVALSLTTSDNESGSCSPSSSCSSSDSKRGLKTMLSPRSKKERRRERNRELASISRERRKHEFEELKRENEELRAKLAKFECQMPKALSAASVASVVALCADSDSSYSSPLSSSAAVLVHYLNVAEHASPLHVLAYVLLLAALAASVLAHARPRLFL